MASGCRSSAPRFGAAPARRGSRWRHECCTLVTARAAAGARRIGEDGQPACGTGGASLRIAIMGSGGVGGYVGGRLAAAGQDVTFLARGAHLAALREHGLALRSALGDVLIRPAQASGDPAAIGPVDLVIFAVKLYDTEAAAAASSPCSGRVRGWSRCRTGSTARACSPACSGESRHRRCRAHRRRDRRAGRDPPHRHHGELRLRRA